jgi:hypothetical protein
MAFGTSYVTSGNITANNIGDIYNPLATKFMVEAKFTVAYPLIISLQMERNTFSFDGVTESAQQIFIGSNEYLLPANETKLSSMRFSIGLQFYISFN